MTPGRGHFWPQGIILTNLVEVYKVMLHNKYQGSRSYGFRQKDFFFFAIAYVKHVTPWSGRFWPQGDNLNKLGRGPLGDVKN